MERETLAVCLPGFNFSSLFLSNWTNLAFWLKDRFNLQVFFGWSNNIYITRNELLESVLSCSEKIDKVLWLDDDNLLEPKHCEMLLRGIDSEGLDGILGWYWLQPQGNHIDPRVSCGEMDDKCCFPFTPRNMLFQSPVIEEVEYGGMGAFLVKFEALKLVGREAFSPVMIPDSKYGFAGDDVSWFMRARDYGLKFGVHKSVKLPHLKLRNADFDSNQFLDMPEELRKAEKIPGWMERVELVWLFEQAKKMKDIVEIGSWQGRSSYALLRGCKGEVTCVDEWKGASDQFPNGQTLFDVAAGVDAHALFLENVGGFKNLRVIKKASVDASSLVDEAEMIFIDAGHEYEDILSDLETWQGKATKLLCGHDVDRIEIRKALEDKGIPYEIGPGRIWFHWIKEDVKELAA